MKNKILQFRPAQEFVNKQRGAKATVLPSKRVERIRVQVRDARVDRRRAA